MRNYLRLMTPGVLLLALGFAIGNTQNAPSTEAPALFSQSLKHYDHPVLAQAAPPGKSVRQSKATMVDPVPMTPGRQQYMQALQHFYSELQMFGDPGQADAFKKEWEHKFDRSGEFNTPAGSMKAVTQLANAGKLLGCPETFDGKCLYARAFRAYLNFHYGPDAGKPNLVKPDERAKWAAEWEHKFANTGDLLTEAGTDSAIRKMRDSLGQRFDYVQSVKATADRKQVTKAQFGGIGVPVGLNNRDKIKFGGDIKLIVHTPDSKSPAHGLAAYGDIIVKIEDEPVDGMTVDEAMKKFVGKAGTKLKLTIQRMDEATKKPVFVDVEFTRTALTDPRTGRSPQGDVDIALPVSVSGMEEMKVGPGSELLASEPSEGSPAKGSIKAGDLITEVDGESLDGLTIEDAVSKIRGPVNKPVTLTIMRADAGGQLQKLTVKITRKVIEQHAVHFKSLGDDISYIKLDQFMSQNIPEDMAAAIARVVLPLASKALMANPSPTSAAQIARFEALKRILEKGGKVEESTFPILVQAAKVYEKYGEGGGLVLDLRGNGGGDMRIFHALANMTMPSGTVLVQVSRKPGTNIIMREEDILTKDFAITAVHPEGASESETEVQPSKRLPLILPANMSFTVLINEGSASASELLAGALQANHRAVIVGKTSVGKGVGQVVLEMPYGRSLSVTNFEFLPGGMKADWIGVVVDIDVDPSTNGKTDPQLDAAVAEIKRQNQLKADRAKAAATSLKRHHDYFDAEIIERANENRKPLHKQDPARMH